jgi:hypothetical protein
MMGLAVAAVVTSASAAQAGFDRWTVESEKDPFTGGTRVTVSLLTSIRSGVNMFCDSAYPGLTIRIVPGYAFEAGFKSASPSVRVAVDEQIVQEAVGQLASVGENFAAIEVNIVSYEARSLINAMMKAQKQIAIDDGFSDRPHLLTARGSTKAGEALQGCNGK